MRIIHINDAAELKAVVARIGGRKPAEQAAFLDRVKALNPHVDLEHIEADTVLLLPDTPGMQAGDNQVGAFGSEVLGEVMRQVEEGFKQAGQRVKLAAKALAAERGEVDAALHVDAVRRQVDSDAALKAQLELALAEMAAEETRIGQAAVQIKAMQQAAEEELKALAQLLG